IKPNRLFPRHQNQRATLRHPHVPQEEMAERNAIILILAALGIREAWTLLPNVEYTFDPFPFYDLELSIQTYVYFLCHYVSMMVFAYTFMMIIISFRPVLAAWF